MSEFNLLETSTFSLSITAQLPGDGVDAVRDFTFKATFKALHQDAWEDLVEDARKSEALREVLVAVDGVPGGTDADGNAVSALDVVVRNPFTCDAAFAHYAMYTTRNGRQIAQQATDGKNSRRSRRR